MRGDVANLPVLLRKPGHLFNPRFVAWPLELGLGTRNPRFVAWPLELGLRARNPRFVVWPLELGLGTLNPRFVAWPLELGLGTRNPRFGCVYKVTVAIYNLGNIVWICPLAAGTLADVLIWDREGPKRSKGHYIDYEIGSMDGAYKGRLHVAWPFIG